MLQSAVDEKTCSSIIIIIIPILLCLGYQKYYSFFNELIYQLPSCWYNKTTVTDHPTERMSATSDSRIENLEFENEMLKEILHEDCLVVLSRGLGMEKLLLNLFLTYTEASGSLIIVIGSSPELENHMIYSMKQCDVASNGLAKVINADVSQSERMKYYRQGGILFLSSRILVVDMLVERIPIEAITGIIVCSAHKILESCQDTFILRLYRSSNKTGFIKAFSQTPSLFSRGYGSLDRMMRSLFVTKMFLWPRYRPEVCQSLEKRATPDVMEMRFSLSPLMESIQFAVMDLINMCLKDMKESNSTYLSDAEELTVENALTPNFTQFLRRQFEPIWYQLNPQMKRLIGDIKLLRQVLFSLTEDDCVTFYCLVESIRQSIKIDSKTSDWIFWEPAETLFVASKERLLSTKKLKKQEVNLEMNPKWTTFCQVINEIREDREKSPSKSESPVVVLVREESTIKKLKDVLEKGPEYTLNELYTRTKIALNSTVPSAPNSDGTTADTPEPKRRRTLEVQNPLELSFSAVINEFKEFQVINNNPQDLEIMYHHQSDGYLQLEQLLLKYHPWYIIMFDPDMESIRRLELYQGRKCSPQKCQIYFFLFEGSAEEQRYLTTLRKEKDAFETLLKEQESLVIPAERDGKTGQHPDLERSYDLKLANSRKAVSRRNVIQQKIIVDMREFRSELPSLIHKRGIDIEPVTIEIGDYVLTPDTCVERKSISDLIGSLNSGRLYNQTSVMTRHYKRSILLIEFDEHLPFNLRNKIGYRRFYTSESQDALPKLILLTITFPQLNLIWSPSPQFSAEIFEYLKVDKDQPETEKVLKISEEQLPVEHLSDKYDLETKEFLLCLPGVNLYNVYRIMNRCMSIMDLLKKSQKELTQMMESEKNSEALFSALHSDLMNVCVNLQIKAKTNLENNSKKFKRKK